MSHANGIISQTGLSISDVKSVIGASSNDLGTLCKHVNINKWAKYKPVWGTNWPTGTNNDYSLILATYSSAANVAANYAEGWAYKRPAGGSASPYRLGDFRGYNHNAKPPFYTQVIATTGSYIEPAEFNAVIWPTASGRPAEFTCYIKDYTGSQNDGGLHLTDFGTLSSYSNWKVGAVTSKQYYAGTSSQYASYVPSSNGNTLSLFSTAHQIALTGLDATHIDMVSGRKTDIYPILYSSASNMLPMPMKPFTVVAKPVSNFITATITNEKCVKSGGVYTISFHVKLQSSIAFSSYTWTAGTSGTTNNAGLSITFRHQSNTMYNTNNVFSLSSTGGSLNPENNFTWEADISQSMTPSSYNGNVSASTTFIGVDINITWYGLGVSVSKANVSIT